MPRDLRRPVEAVRGAARWRAVCSGSVIAIASSRSGRAARRRALRASGTLKALPRQRLGRLGELGVGGRAEASPRSPARRAAPPRPRVARQGLCATPPSAMRTSRDRAVRRRRARRPPRPARRRTRPGRAPCGSVDRRPRGSGGSSTAVISSPCSRTVSRCGSSPGSRCRSASGIAPLAVRARARRPTASSAAMRDGHVRGVGGDAVRRRRRGSAW